ncbi:MAG: non-ribosomal peptide synthetase, partial [bacterium]
GVPVANRSLPELSQLIGYFVNALPLRIQISAESSFLDLLYLVKQNVLQALEHQAYPFEKIVENLQPARSLSHTPIFQHMFAFQPEETETIRLPDIQIRQISVEASSAKYDMMLSLNDQGETISGEWEYSTDLFTRDTMFRLVANFETLLTGIVASPHESISRIPLISASEQQLLSELTQGPSLPLDGSCVHQLFERQVRETPHEVAVECGDEKLTYQELNERSQEVAVHLKEVGVRPGDLVGLCVKRTPELIIGLIGILKSGAAYVPLDPAYPKDRLSAIAEDAQLSFIVGDSSLKRRSATSERRSHHRLSHVIYTSGSTGRPKGVMIEHRSVVAFLGWVHQTYSADELRRVLFSTSVCFDLSVFELWAPLTCGGTVVVVENALSLCEERGADVTLINTVPSALKVLLEHDAVPRTATVINVAGEPLAKELVNAALQLDSVRKVFNLYGPTEDTTYSTFVCFTEPLDTNTTIGRPISNTQVYLLDGELNPVPVGVGGEIYIAGVGLARGYL